MCFSILFLPSTALRWPVNILVLVYSNSPAIVAAVVLAFITDIIGILGSYLPRIQIWYLLRQKNLIRNKDGFFKLGALINDGVNCVAEDYKKNKQELSYAAVNSMLHYIYHSVEYISVGSTENEGVLHSVGFLKNARQYIEVKDKELYESILLYVRTFDIERYLQHFNWGEKTNYSIFPNANDVTTQIN